MDLRRLENYNQAVIAAYKIAKNNHSLSANLDRPTPAKLKRECLDLFHERNTPQEYEPFKAFFGKKNNKQEYYNALQHADPDMFRPLNALLRSGAENNLTERNIHLLAWMINFEHGPYRPGGTYDFLSFKNPSSPPEKTSEPGLDSEIPTGQLEVEDKGESKDLEKEKPGAEEKPENLGNKTATNDESYDGKKPVRNDDTQFGKTNERKENEQDPTGGSDRGSFPYTTIPRKFYTTKIVLLAAVVTVFASYLFYDKSKGQCMYWDGDEYQSIACDQKVDNTAIVLLDTSKLVHLKKITNLKEITRNDIGKVHYAKENGEVTFYTSGGENPTNSEKRLLPMTEYMFEKYVLNKVAN